MVLGSQRSGSTLLGMALQAHGGIEIIEENNPAFHVRSASSPIQIDLQVVNAYKQEEGKLVGFKSPRDSHRIAEIIRTIPQIRIAWITRDIFQVVASMASLRMQSGATWANSFTHEEIIKYLLVKRNDSEIAELYEWARSLQDERERSIVLASVCWFSKHRLEVDAVAAWPELIHRISYEDLVAQPEVTLRELLDFLGIEWSPETLNHPAVLSGKRPGGTTTDRSIDSKSLDKWRSELSREDLELIDRVVRRLK
jgi:hypothetical protein